MACQNMWTTSVKRAFQWAQVWVRHLLRTDILRDFSGIAEVGHLDRQGINRDAEAGLGQLKVAPVSCTVYQ